MNAKSKTRLALLRRKINEHLRESNKSLLTQKMLADRCNFSLIYIKLIETGHIERLARKAALALSTATGASVDWLMGKGKDGYIESFLGTKWTPQIYDQIQNRREQGSSVSEAVQVVRWYLKYTDAMARIMFAAFAKRKAQLASALIYESQRELWRKFKPPGNWPIEPWEKPKPTPTEFPANMTEEGIAAFLTRKAHAAMPESVAAGVAQRLMKNLRAVSSSSFKRSPRP